ncbi:MAG: hypothetical protein N3E40_03425, partial [Dehalococcoidia bacterium]|nr:hypothetical protein [Dehalococcoidia bacterium]
VYMVLTPFATGFLILLVINIIAGLRAAVTSATSSALMVGEGRKFGMGVAMAMTTMANTIGYGVGPIFGGAVVDLFGLTANFYAAALLTLSGAAVFMVFTRPTGRGPAAPS